MKSYAIEVPGKGMVVYRDRKRLLWLGSLVYPVLALSGIGLYLLTGYEWTLLTPIIATYGLVPLLDWLMGEDPSNPPEELVPALDADPYYRWLPILTVPLHFGVLIVIAAFAGTQALSPGAFLVVAFTAGFYSGLGINTGHELGHKKQGLERWLARVVLAVPAYGHFGVEHNRGHHRNVATPEDPASSRMGESIYRFALREIPGGFRRGWATERERLTRQGRSAWSIHNEVLQSYALSAVVQLSLIAAFGVVMIPFLIIHNIVAWWQLTSANYIEHYGLLRQKLLTGGYEHCQPHHSWNTNCIVSNLMLFHLERHSDHHAHPTRRYQSLRNFPELPTLPADYQALYLVAMVPPLWFALMDRRLLALPHVRGDLSRVNIEPTRRAAIERCYGSATARTST